ncbi:hypothetical protein [Microcoleus sp. herbarium2]|uniref:hypothetical protein n=1 Tax=Microcoleus sp. herbarium2 TaxID=3055433 RepID=UPI002FD6E072
MGLTDFAVTSNGSKYQHPRATKKYERNLKRKQKKLDRKTDKTTKNRDDRRSGLLPRFIQ